MQKYFQIVNISSIEILKIVRTIINYGRNSLNSEVFITDCIETDDGLKIATTFNDYFVNVGPTIASEITKGEINLFS